MRSLLLVWVLVVTPLATAEVASADAIRIPTCPRGWEGRRVGHGGFCFPVACTGDAQCEGGRCREVARCWTERRRPAGRRPTDDMVWVPEQRECGPEGPCRRGECRRARECVYEGAPMAAEPEEACSGSGSRCSAQRADVLVPPVSRSGCSVLHPASAPGFLLALGLAALFAVRLRWR